MVTHQPGAEDALDPAVWKIASVAAFGAFFSQLSATTANVSLSNLAVELHSTLSTIQWVASAYLFALTLALPLSGWLVERVGTKPLYIWCFGAFTLFSMLCGLAWSAPSLIAFRILQGLSAGVLAPMAQMVVARAAGRHMARVMGYSGVPLLLAPVLGPVIAGAILEHASWHWLFLMNLPFGVIGMVLAFMFLPEDEDEPRQRALDWVGLATLSPGLLLFLYGSEHVAGAAGLVTVLAGVFFLAAFFWNAKRKGDDALIALRLFENKIFSTAGSTMFMSLGVVYAGQLLIPLYLIDVAGYTPTQMGWALAPLGLGMMITFAMMGTLTERLGLRWLSAGGAFLAFFSTLAFVYFGIERSGFLPLSVALFLRGVGQGAVGIPSLSAAYASVNRRDLPMATTAINIMQRLGGAALTTLCAAFLASRLDAVPAGETSSSPYVWALLLLSGLHLLNALAAVRLPLRVEGSGARR